MTGQRPARALVNSLQRTLRCLAGVVFVLLCLLLADRFVRAAPQDEPPPFPEDLRPAVAPPPEARPRANPPAGTSPDDLAVPSVSVRVRAPSRVAVSQDLTYRLEVVNCSRATAHHVIVRVAVPAELAAFVRATPEPSDRVPVYIWRLGTMAPCARRDLTLVVHPLGQEEVSCCARVQFEHGQCVRTSVGKSMAAPAPPPAPLARTPPLERKSGPAPGPRGNLEPLVPRPRGNLEPVAARPVLQVRMTGPSERELYDIFDYRIEVRNVGRGVARDVVVRDTLPKGVDYMNSRPSTKGEGTLVWNLGELAPGQTQTIQCQVVTKQTGALTNQVTVEALGAERQQSSHTLRVGQPRLVVTKAGPRKRGVGRLTTFHLSVINLGNMTANHVEMSDELAPEVEFVSASNSGRFQAGKVRWTLGTLAPGERRAVSVVVRARKNGQFENVCEVTAARGLIEQGKMVTVFEESAEMGIELDPARNPVEKGQMANVVVRVYNAGKADHTNVQAIITLPEGLRFVDLPGTRGQEVKDRKIFLPRRELKAGGDLYVTLQVQAEKVGKLPLTVEVLSDSIGPDRAMKATEELIVVEPAATTSRKPMSNW